MMLREKVVDAYTCDCCGAEIDDKANASITVRYNSEIYYEWWAQGDYCEHCADMLVSAIIDAIPVPERYENKFRDKDACVACETSLIKSQSELDGGY